MTSTKQQQKNSRRLRRGPPLRPGPRRPRQHPRALLRAPRHGTEREKRQNYCARRGRSERHPQSQGPFFLEEARRRRQGLFHEGARPRPEPRRVLRALNPDRRCFSCVFFPGFSRYPGARDPLAALALPVAQAQARQQRSRRGDVVVASLDPFFCPFPLPLPRRQRRRPRQLLLAFAAAAAAEEACEALEKAAAAAAAGSAAAAMEPEAFPLSSAPPSPSASPSKEEVDNNDDDERKAKKSRSASLSLAVPVAAASTPAAAAARTTPKTPTPASAPAALPTWTSPRKQARVDYAAQNYGRARAAATASSGPLAAALKLGIFELTAAPELYALKNKRKMAQPKPARFDLF